ncbi:MAG: lipid-A-disaccharide synthase, partial [Rickettsiales bacterium]
AKLYDLLLAILPFEPPYFEKHGLETIFIGHPVVEDFQASLKLNSEENNFRTKSQIPENDLLICAMAGSRIGEVKRILPEIIGAINILSIKHPNLTVVLPVIERTKTIFAQYLNQFKARVILIDESQKKSAFKAANLAIAKSGTNNLEIAIAGLPMVTIYKINPITHFIVKKLIKIKYANLINLILNRELIPELLQDNCNSTKIAETAEHLINNPNLANGQILEGRKVLNILGLDSLITPSQKAAKKILSYL